MRMRETAAFFDSRDVKKTIKRIYDKYKVLLEPHGAVGWRGLEVYLELFGDSPLCVSLETAHPAKFPDEIRELLAIEPELPQSMKDLDSRSGQPVFLTADYGEVKTYLLNRLRAAD